MKSTSVLSSVCPSLFYSWRGTVALWQPSGGDSDGFPTLPTHPIDVGPQQSLRPYWRTSSRLSVTNSLSAILEGTGLGDTPFATLDLHPMILARSEPEQLAAAALVTSLSIESFARDEPELCCGCFTAGCHPEQQEASAHHEADASWIQSAPSHGDGLAQPSLCRRGLYESANGLVSTTEDSPLWTNPMSWSSLRGWWQDLRVWSRRLAYGRREPNYPGALAFRRRRSSSGTLPEATVGVHRAVLASASLVLDDEPWSSPTTSSDAPRLVGQFIDERTPPHARWECRDPTQVKGSSSSPSPAGPRGAPTGGLPCVGTRD